MSQRGLAGNDIDSVCYTFQSPELESHHLALQNEIACTLWFAEDAIFQFQYPLIKAEIETMSWFWKVDYTIYVFLDNIYESIHKHILDNCNGKNLIRALIKFFKDIFFPIFSNISNIFPIFKNIPILSF